MRKVAAPISYAGLVAARDLAARRVRERIERDAEGAGSRVGTILAEIGRRLFEPGLTYERLSGELGIRDHGRAVEVKRAIGIGPGGYIRLRRLEVAEAMLVETAIPIAEVASLVGYVQPISFTKVFRELYGVSPSAYRQAANAGVATPASTPEARALEPRSLGLLNRLLRQPLDRAELLEAVRGALEHNPAAAVAVAELALERAIASPVSATARGGADEAGDRGLEAIERVLANAAWCLMATRRWPHQVEVIRTHPWLVRPALLALLGERYLEAARRDPVEGVRVAKLALAVAIGLDGASDEDGTCEHQALAWAWIGNAKRLALDFHGADAAFRTAQQRLPGNASDAVMADVLMLEAALRCYQCRYQQVEELFARADPRLRILSDSRRLALALNLVAGARYCSGNLNRALSSFREAVAFATRARDTQLCALSEANLTAFLLEIGDSGGAKKIQCRLEAQMGTAETPVRARITWSSGVIALEQGRAAEALEALNQAKALLLEAGRIDLAALADLDAVQCLLALGQDADAVRRCIDCLNVLDSLAANTAAAPALTALHLACERLVIDPNAVRSARQRAGSLKGLWLGRSQ